MIWGAHFAQNLTGDTAFDLKCGTCICQTTYGGHGLRFEVWGAHFANNLRGTLLAICDLENSFCQKLKGDTACDLRFGDLILLKT